MLLFLGSVAAAVFIRQLQAHLENKRPVGCESDRYGELCFLVKRRSHK